MRRRVIVLSLVLCACGTQATADAGADATYGHVDDDAPFDTADAASDTEADAPITFPYDAATYDASWYDGGVAEPCPILETPCAQPAYIIYGCACFNEHCASDGLWEVIEGGGPCH